MSRSLSSTVGTSTARTAGQSFPSAKRPSRILPSSIARDKYDVYVGLRTRQSTRPLTGEYPILIGPFDFGSTANQQKPVTAEQVAQIGDCVQFVLFGVEKNSVLSEPFKPASMATRPVVFNKASSCR